MEYGWRIDMLRVFIDIWQQIENSFTCCLYNISPVAQKHSL